MSRLICGIQPVREAIRAHGDKLEKVVVEASHPPSPQHDAIARFAKDHSVVVERASRMELDRLTDKARHQGVAAWGPDLQLTELDAICELAKDGASPIVLALDEVQDPQNFGAVVRSAVALGASAVMWPEHSSAPLSPAMFRASAGAVEHATLCRVTGLPTAISALKEHGFEIIGLDANAESPLPSLKLSGPIVLIIGAEGKGLRRSVKTACTQLAKLPMSGKIASLNASVASAIALYEAIRQRSQTP